ncbi:MAG TPA: CHAT domain-containing protein, partial [Xanthobacteraceae bacterium]|nr:CHAT domain-containing protein [Xanthobacteraceae bacterium]
MTRRYGLGAFTGALCATVLGSLILLQPAFAASFEQIVETCRQAVRPQVHACMQGKRGSGDRETNLAACRGAVTAIVHACVARETQRAAAGKPPPGAPKGETVEMPKNASPVQAGFVAPPRTIADITAILDKERPDPAKLAELKADADAAPPKGASAADLAQFYYDRGNARALLARNKEALADGLKALEVGKGAIEFRQVWRIRQFVGLQHIAIGDPKQAVAVFQSMVRDSDQPGTRGGVINASRILAQILVSMGDVSQADAYARRVGALVQEARGSPHPKWRKSYAVSGNSWEGDADAARGLIFEARGQYREAEAAYRRAEAFRRASLKDLDKYDYPPPPEQVLLAADSNLLSIAHVKAKQGRLGEAEADARRALLEVLKNQGKYNPQSPKFIVGLAGILVEQGRYQEAEKLTRSALEVQRTLSVGDDSPATANILSQLGGVLILQRKTKEAALVYRQLDTAVAQWEPRRRDVFLLNGSRIAALYASGQLEAGIAAAQELVKRQSARFGENHFDTASAHGTLAVGYARAGRAAEAIREFKAAIPIMLAGSRENADDDATIVAARSQRLQTIVEAYIGLLARGPNKSNEAAVETFALADAVRGHSVQQALAASSARMVAKDPALAELVRKEQDLGKQINAELGTLNNVLALPSSERDEKGVLAISAALEKLRAERDKARQEINRRFPSYADLVDPKPPPVEQIKATLRPGEAMLSFYFGQSGSFVWAVPKDGAIAFASVAVTSLELEAKVRKLREALDPQATMLSDIPAFDLALGYELYSSLLKPVEEGWKSAKSLILVTNGALGLLPLSLLPTAPAEIKKDDEPMFAAYKQVPWLARSHAVTIVPSAAALRTLRALPPGKPTRDKLIAFGDPLFSKQQAEDAAKPIQVAELGTTVRGVPLRRRSSPQLEGVDSAELAMLPRLPDTADELRSIAIALEADPAKALYLGKDANEQKVKSLDLSGFKILAFATHGLVPGELNGLTQPALALSAPDVSDSEGDGLLTMEEILALKLDADWVVLSACNTGTGAGAGAEAASGLGRAFFYAGTRALLVTNWSVHSASARELVSDLFRRQAKDPKITRGEALR